MLDMDATKARVREAMRVVCSPHASDAQRKECESFLDGTFRAKFEENIELVLDVLGGIARKEGRGGGGGGEESVEVAVFVCKSVLHYVRRAKMDTDTTAVDVNANVSRNNNINNSSLIRVLFQSIVANELLNVRGKEIEACAEFAALSAAVAAMKMVRSEEDVETLLESSATHFREGNSAHAFVHYLKAFGESVHDKNVGAIRPERRKLIANSAARACVFVCRALEEVHQSLSTNTEEDVTLVALMFDCGAIWLNEVNPSASSELFYPKPSVLLERSVQLACSPGDSKVQSSAMSFASTLLEALVQQEGTNREALAQCLSFVSQVGTSKEACKSAQNRSLEIILATVNGALKRDDTEIVSFCLDACANVLLANPDSPASCFDAWVKISSSSASAFDLDKETTQKYVPNAVVVLDALATFLLENFRRHPLEMEAIRDEIGDSCREIINSIGTNPILPILVQGLQTEKGLGYVFVFQILSYRMKNTFGGDESDKDDSSDGDINLFNIAIQAVVDALMHFSDAREAVCWSFVGLAKDIAISRKLSKYCLRALSEVLCSTKDPVHSRGAATAIMRICDCSKESLFLDPEVSNYLGQMLERAYVENLVTPTALHDLRDGQEPTNTVVLRAAVRANCTSMEALGRLFRKASENAMIAIHNQHGAHVGHALVDVSIALQSQKSYDVDTKKMALEILSHALSPAQSSVVPLKELRLLLQVFATNDNDAVFLAPVLFMIMRTYLSICSNGSSYLANELIDTVRLTYVKNITHSYSSSVALHDSITMNFELFERMGISYEDIVGVFSGTSLDDIVAKVLDMNLKDTVTNFTDDPDRFPSVYGLAQVLVRSDCGYVLSNERLELLLGAVSTSLRTGCSDENAISVLALAGDLACRSIDGFDPSKASASFGGNKVVGVVHGSLVNNNVSNVKLVLPNWTLNRTHTSIHLPQMTLPLLLRGLLEAANEYFPAQLLTDIAATCFAILKSVGPGIFREALCISLGDENDKFPRPSATQKFKSGFIDDITSEATMQHVRNFKRSLKKFVGGKRSAAGS